MAETIYDAIVVGSGAAGSIAAKQLTGRGLTVLLLEAGRAIGPEDFEASSKGPKEKGIQLWARIRASLTGQPLQSRVALYGAQQRHLFVKDSENPYTSGAGNPFLWIRGKQVGGRLHTFGRVLMRWSDYDFKAGGQDGQSPDWPIAYEDLEEYYSQIEQFMSVRGCADHVPNVPDGNFAGPSKLSKAEQQFKQRTQQRWEGRHVIPWRYAPPNAKRVPLGILAAEATGLLTLRPDSVVRRILVDNTTGLATGVEVCDRVTSAVLSFKAGIVLVCASPIESVRLMLNSQSARHPNGLGNNSDNLGRYFMDQVPCIIMGTVPGFTGNEVDDTLPPDPFYGVTGGVYIPRFANLDQNSAQPFARGFGYQGTIGRLFRPADQPAKFGIMGFGEMLPYKTNRITLHGSRKDKWGMPIPSINCAINENEQALLKEQVRSIAAMADNAGLETEFYGSSLGVKEFGKGAFPEADIVSRTLFRLFFKKSMAMGAAIHESGGARMGTDPASSVLNGLNQCWDAPNVYVTDASSFVTSGCSGTTLTMMANTLRVCDAIADGKR